MPAVGGATVDYAQTPYAAAAGPAVGGGGGGGEHGDGWLGWLKDTVQKSEVLSKVAERARTSMDSMITTLDPQMRDIICEYGAGAGGVCLGRRCCGLWRPDVGCMNYVGCQVSACI